MCDEYLWWLSCIVSGRFNLWTKIREWVLIHLSSISFDVGMSQVPIGVAPKNETLHLALPHAFVDDDPSGVGNGGVQYRRSRPVSRAPSLLEAKSPGFINTRLVNYNRGVSYQPSMRSVSHSQYHSEPENIPPPSSEEEKLKTTKWVGRVHFSMLKFHSPSFSGVTLLQYRPSVMQFFSSYSAR